MNLAISLSEVWIFVLYVYMYVYMYVCMYVGTYVCMYSYTHVCMRKTYDFYHKITIGFNFSNDQRCRAFIPYWHSPTLDFHGTPPDGKRRHHTKFSLTEAQMIYNGHQQVKFPRYLWKGSPGTNMFCSTIHTLAHYSGFHVNCGHQY